MKRFMLLAAMSALTMLVLTPAAFGQSRGPSGADGSYNCPDFDTQEQAQAFFDSAGAGDPNGLDADSDGQACEDSLPSGGTGGEMTETPAPEQVSCSGFASQFGAQQFYDFNATPEQQAMLDADSDGFACEEGDQGTATTQYEPPVAPATEAPAVTAPAAATPLPETGGPALLLPLSAGLLLAGGLAMGLLRRR